VVYAVAAALDGAPPARAFLGPTTERQSGQWLTVPVAGLDELAADVFDATVLLVPVTHPRSGPTLYSHEVLVTGVPTRSA
jgi:hypothetical protein